MTTLKADLQRNPFALSLRTALPTSTDLATPFRGDAKLSKREKWLQEEVRIHGAMMEAHTKKAAFAIACVADTNVFAHAAFSFGTAKMGQQEQALEATSRHSDVMTQFTDALLQHFGQQLIGISDISGMNIAQAMSFDMYPPEQKQGIVQKLFGGPGR